MNYLKSILFILLFYFLFSSCHSVNPNGNLKVFRFNISIGLNSLDPAYAAVQSNVWIVNLMYNGLVQTDDKLNVVPCIAKNWDISPDGIVYTFHLRSDVLFHNSKQFL